MKCTCGRTNAAPRRFCGDCGGALQRTCTRCAFVNECHDRFCGGCGSGLVEGAQASAASEAGFSGLRAVPTPLPTQKITLPPPAEDLSGVPALSQDELAELLAKPEEKKAAEPALPSRVTQDDLDKLFGAGS